MVNPDDYVPFEELQTRRARCLDILSRLSPEAGGLLVFGRVNIYYLTGSMTAGVLWLPLEGEPVLMVRKGLGRVRDQSSHTNSDSYASYEQLPGIAAEHGSPFTKVMAVEQAGLPWSLAINLQKHLKDYEFVQGDPVFLVARSVKTPWELAVLREAGKRHGMAFEEILPSHMRPGWTELRIAHKLWEIFFSLNCSGMCRMSNFGEEMFLGEVSAGNNANYPVFYNGPLGCLGFHPSTPFMGSADTVWERDRVLNIDTVFCYYGYHTDKTTCYFGGPKSHIPAKAQEAHDLCREIELKTSEMLRPGAIPSEIWEHSKAMIAKGGFEAGYQGLGENKIYFLGHGIGLCVDEWPVLTSRFDFPLEAGMVIAVEPKIALRGFGMVGSENVWEVTESGGVCLTGGSRDIICVE